MHQQWFGAGAGNNLFRMVIEVIVAFEFAGNGLSERQAAANACIFCIVLLDG